MVRESMFGPFGLSPQQAASAIRNQLESWTSGSLAVDGPSRAVVRGMAGEFGAMFARLNPAFQISDFLRDCGFGVDE